MSDNPTEPIVDLAFIARTLQRLTNDVEAFRDEMRVQTAMILRMDAAISRQDAMMQGMLEQLRAMVTQHQRTADRVRRLEEART